MANAVEAMWQDMEQEAADELMRRERHHALPLRTIAAVVFVAEGDTGLVERDQTPARDGDAVGVAREIGEHGLGASERRFGIDHPPLLPDRSEVTQEKAVVGETGLVAEEGKSSDPVELDQPGEEQTAEEPAQYPHRQQEGRTGRYPALPIGRDAAAWHDHVDMGMVRHRRSPCVEHSGDADARAKVSWVSRDRYHRLRRRAEQEIVDDSLVLPGDVRDLGGKREDDMEVTDRQQIGFALGQPDASSGALALRAMPVAATVVGNAPVPAVLAGIDVAAQRGRAAVLDRRHDFELGQAQVTGLGGTIPNSFSPEDIGDPERGAQAASAAGILAPHQRRQMFERTGHRADRFGRDARVERGRVQLAVTQQNPRLRRGKPG
jgi:hypothetical protein